MTKKKDVHLCQERHEKERKKSGKIIKAIVIIKKNKT